jgi:hypothetical protein
MSDYLIRHTAENEQKTGSLSRRTSAESGVNVVATHYGAVWPREWCLEECWSIETNKLKFCTTGATYLFEQMDEMFREMNIPVVGRIPIQQIHVEITITVIK